MEKTDIRYQTYLKILKEELVPAMGCTEPIALAYAAAEARRILGGLPESVKIEVSGSIIKNVKSVIVPNTNHMKGIPAAAAAQIHPSAQTSSPSSAPQATVTMAAQGSSRRKVCQKRFHGRGSVPRTQWATAS